jgi:hypothetical protein
MDNGETIMPVPEGIISTSTGPVDPNAPVIDAEEAQDIADFDAAVAELEEVELPEE